jgi:hypothetical protein
MQEKQKYYLAILILVIVAILLNVYAGKKTKKLESVLSTDSVETVLSEVSSVPVEKIVARTVISRPGITVLGQDKSVLAKKNPGVAKEKPSGESGTVSQLEVAPQQGESDPVSVISKPGKYPTTEEKREMNAKGIILY